MHSGQLLGHTDLLSSSSYSLLLTADPGHIREAQHLRHRVFSEEFGASSNSIDADLDIDRFDQFCDHHVVRENASGDVVGTYRLLPPDAALVAGGLYSDVEFDCAALDGLRPCLVEAGRSCVAPEHRSGAVVGMVWAGIVKYLLLTGNHWLAGCASVSVADGGALASGVWQRVSERHLGPEQFRVRPLQPFCPTGVPTGAVTLPPPLLRGYLRLGAWVCGPPAFDPLFGCADFPVLFHLDRLDHRYARRFLEPDT